MKLTDIILSELSIAGEMQKYDVIVEHVSNAISEKYDIPNDGLLQGTIRVAVAEAMDTINEGWNDNIEQITIAYTTNGDLYSISIDGEKQRDDDLKKVKDFLQDTSGVDISTDKKIDKVIDAMKDHGIAVDTTEMDVS